MELSVALDFVRRRRQGVLATIGTSGLPHLTNILYSTAEQSGGHSDVVIEVSITDTRAKTRNLRRDPRAVLYVVGDDFWHYVVIEAHAELTPPAANADDETVDGLVALYRRLAGEHPNWEEYRSAMVDERRVVLRLRPQRAYGILS